MGSRRERFNVNNINDLDLTLLKEHKKNAKKTGPKPGKKRQPNDLIWYIEKLFVLN